MQPTDWKTCKEKECAPTVVVQEKKTYSRKVWSFGQCSEICGLWTRKRDVWCEQDDTGERKSDLYCTWRRPFDWEECNEKDCVEDIPVEETYFWFTWDWGTCSEPCEGWEQSRTVQCKNSLWEVVWENYCTETKPLGVQSCNEQLCPDKAHDVADEEPVTYSWRTLWWSACSVSCWWWEQTRQVDCMDSNGNEVAEEYCFDQEEPPSFQECNNQSCLPPWCGELHLWMVEFAKISSIWKEDTNYNYCAHIPDSAISLQTNTEVSPQRLEWECPITQSTGEIEEKACYLEIIPGAEVRCGYAHDNTYWFFFDWSEQHPEAFCANEWAVMTDYEETAMWWMWKCTYEWSLPNTCTANKNYLVCEEKEFCACSLDYAFVADSDSEPIQP